MLKVLGELFDGFVLVTPGEVVDDDCVGRDKAGGVPLVDAVGNLFRFTRPGVGHVEKGDYCEPVQVERAHLGRVMRRRWGINYIYDGRI